MERERLIKEFADYLQMEEKSDATISKYLHDAAEMLDFMDAGKFGEINKEMLIQYRQYLSTQCRAQTVNGKLSAVNSYLRYMNMEMYKVKFLKVQRKAYVDEKREMTECDYKRLLETTIRQGKTQMYFLMQVLYGTGIRISELPYVTVEAVDQGKAEIYLKGKYRVIIFPRNLVKKLKEYIKNMKIQSGCIFRTRSGRCLDRSNICHSMKKICQEAGVEKSKVFPHNFRHLFAKSFYAIEKNLAHLADILGHSSIETTRIYVAASIKQYEKVMNRMNIVVDEKIPQNIHSAVSQIMEIPQNIHSVVPCQHI